MWIPPAVLTCARKWVLGLVPKYKDSRGWGGKSQCSTGVPQGVIISHLEDVRVGRCYCDSVACSENRLCKSKESQRLQQGFSGHLEAACKYLPLGCGANTVLSKASSVTDYKVSFPSSIKTLECRVREKDLSHKKLM